MGLHSAGHGGGGRTSASQSGGSPFIQYSVAAATLSEEGDGGRARIDRVAGVRVGWLEVWQGDALGCLRMKQKQPRRQGCVKDGY